MYPRHYVLRFEPDFDQFIFHGSAQVEIVAETATTKVVLNAKELTIHSCKLKAEGGELDCSFSLEADKEELLIELPHEISGEHTLVIDFDGVHNDNLYGFYKSRMTYDGKVDYMVSTQFEERDARAAFPCFDEPALKATFDIEYVIDPKLKGISNTEPVDEVILPSGKKLVKFERTPIMSTYLLYFGIGNFEFLVDDSKAPKLRIAAAPGRSQFGKFALDIARKSFDYGEKYFQAPYPLTKCDFIVVEDFMAGAMENYGAITFREHMLLVHPGKTSKPQKVGIAQVVAHEIAHMWFGDLVSPSKWKYIWLNESFATYFTYAIPDEYFPEWKSWEELAGGRGLAGFARDALISTIPVELPGDAEINIDASNAPIIYSKGALIMQVLAGYLGKEKFFKGIRHYLQKHAYGATTSEDCWVALEEATSEPIQEFAHSWVNQEGHPFIQVARNGDQLALEQHRFTLLPHESPTVWYIPLKIRLFRGDGSEEDLDLIMKDRSMTVDLPAGVTSFKINAGQTGFYRVFYPLEEINHLGELAKAKRLSVLDRFGLENDYYHFVQRGDYSVDSYLQFIQQYYADEDNALLLTNIGENLLRIELVADKMREAVHKVGIAIAEHALEKLGFLPREDEISMDAEARSLLIWLGGHFGSPKIRDFAREQFEKLKAGEAIPADIYGSVIRLGAELDPDSWDYMAAQVTDTEVAEAQKQFLLAGLGCFTRRDLLEKSLELNLTKIPKLNRASIINRIALNPVSAGWFWEYYVSKFPELKEAIPRSQLGNTLAFTPVFCGIYALDSVLAFLKKVGEEIKPAKGITEMSAERAKIYARLHSNQ